MKPIAVLFLVLAALAALVFGLLTLGKGSSPDPVPMDQPVPTQTTSTPAPTKIEHVAEDKRNTLPAKVEDPLRSQVDPTKYVYSNELKVTVLDAQSKPLADVEVTLTTFSSRDVFFVDDKRAPFQVGPMRTDKDGHTSFLSIPPQRKYTLVCVHPDYARAEQDTVTVDQDGVFEEPPIKMSSGGKLQGYVRDEQGNAVPDATISLEGLLAETLQFVAPDRQEVRTNADGFYTVTNIPPGQSRKMSVSAKGYGRMIHGPINFEKDQTLNRDFTLRVAEMIYGRVIGPGNTPIVGAKVLAVGLNNATQTGRDDTLTDEKGEFHFESLAPGEYNVVANMRGWRIPPLPRVKTNTSNNVLEGQREASICGQVVDAATGAPLGEFTCQMRAFSDPNTPTYPIDNKQSFRDVQGNFCLEGVQQGEYVVEAWADGYAPTYSQNFVVSMGKNVQAVSVRLTKGGSISGRIVDPEGRPVSKARIMTKPNDWSDDAFTDSIADMYPSNVTQVEARTGKDGTFVLNNLTPTQYQLIIEAAGYTRSSKLNVSVTEGVDAKQGDMKITRGGTLVGTVFDSTGKGVAGAVINLTPSDNQILVMQFSTKAGADGRYIVKNVSPGRYMVRANRNTSPDANPLEQLQIGRDSERQITIAEDQETKLDLTMQK